MKTKLLYVNDDNAITKAGNIIRNGGLVAFPTETVYGLGANALSETAVSSIFRAKGRPQDNPLILHIADRESVALYTDGIPDKAYMLFDHFWPGPLTVVLPKNKVIPGIVSAGLPTIAIRMPDHPAALLLIRAAGVPIAAPSANISGRPSPTCASHVLEDLSGKIDAVLDGGECRIGLESTVVSLCEDIPVLLRPGEVTPDELLKVLGTLCIDDTILKYPLYDFLPRSPGMKYRHYAPKAQLTILRGDRDAVRGFIKKETVNKENNVAVLCFDGEEYDYPEFYAVSYGDKDNPLSLAKNLFSALRKIDNAGCHRVFARCPDTEGVGLAVYNRILKAAGYTVIDV